MKRSLIAPAVLLLSACSTNSQLNVVDNLTLVAKNNGAAMNPSRWVVEGHPLQTTYVSLNGQLGLKVGQICIASGFRSPFTNNCRAAEGGKFYREYYKADGDKGSKSDFADFLDAVYAERTATASFVQKSRDYFSCVIRQKEQAVSDKNNSEKALEQTKEQLSTLCVESQQARNQAADQLSRERLALQKQMSVPNRLLYNWSDTHRIEGGVVVKEAFSLGQHEKEASGYTIVNGLLLERYEVNCDQIASLVKDNKDNSRLKVVTMTLSADDLYYDARKDATTMMATNFSFSTNELKDLEFIFDSKVDVEVKAALANSYNLSSSGYLKGIKETTATDGSSSNKGLTYYAVLTDLKSFQCSKNDSDSIIAMMGQAD